jgi:hypothetical protein
VRKRVLAAALAAVGAFALPGSPAQAEGVEVYFGIEGALLSHTGDSFGSSGLSIEPENGWGGRLYADVLLQRGLLLRGSVNGAWLDAGERQEFASGPAMSSFDRISELDARWATFEAFCSWWFGRTGRPHTWVGLGGGLEYADLLNRFDERGTFTFEGMSLSDHVRQDSTFWGIGPRFGGFIDHELGQSGLHIFGEAGVAYLFGGRDTELRIRSSMSSIDRNEGAGQNVWHLGARLGVGYELEVGGLEGRISAGWRFDRFEDANNTLFLPDSKDGDSSFSGPFMSVGVALPL